ncbi:glycine--tRNA ligase-like [Sitodiplosis mosellana]|uniref:glycine--tRNA ligase-like n=1 Tax=Sitodiplosis mosellana TaxID=263140 RepID=UPI002444C8A6|nr:glycine--tRNA ligase-like [Sitodiplosis mosellana]
MFRFQLLCKNVNVLKQLRCWSVSTQFFRAITNESLQSSHDSTPTSKTDIASLKQLVKEQGDLVRRLKENGTAETELKSAIDELLRRKEKLLETERQSTHDVFSIDRTKFEILVRRRFVYDQSYEIYGGASGFYDLGPIGCALKTNLLHLWRRFFVLEDQMLEVDCPAMTIERVFKASGHIDRFTDYLVKDTVTNECFRVDHLIKSHLQQLTVKNPQFKGLYDETVTKLESATKSDLKELIQKFSVKSPLTGNDLTDPVEFNLMFDTQVGPSSLIKGYLRPETAQGIFVNFKRLLEYNQGRLPFAAAQIGNAFRNEIAPRSGLLRVREFTMAEIEHFFDPTEKTHPKFSDIKDTKLLLYSAKNQENNESASEISIGDAVEKGLVANETLGYFLARIQQFLLRVGISPNYLRFRQHMANEMAHYAVNCWDAECLTSHGWIECVGCADRSAYDLQQHSKASGVNLTAERRLTAPREVVIADIVPTREYIKKLSSKKSKQLGKYLEGLNQKQKKTLLEAINDKGSFEVNLEENKTIKLEKSSIEVKNVSKLVHVEEITPNVIEPSFGIGRILYAVLEHSFRKRDGESNSYFALPTSIAAHKCSILPLSNRNEFQPFIKRISSELVNEDVSHKIDDISGSIGRRYVRSDEIGIPFSITIDFDSLKIPNTVTLRERDTKEQLRIPLGQISKVIRDLSYEKTNWHQLTGKYPRFVKQQS